VTTRPSKASDRHPRTGPPPGQASAAAEGRTGRDVPAAPTPAEDTSLNSTAYDLGVAREAFPGRSVTPHRVQRSLVISGDIGDYDEHIHTILLQAYPGQRVTYDGDVWVIWPPLTHA
jgi:hypothetical protein